MKYVREIAAIAFFLGTTVPAFADCAQSDAAGSWTAYSVGVNKGQTFWLKCALTIEQTGTIAEKSSQCVDSAGASTKVGGSVKLEYKDSCTYTGVIKYEAIGESSFIDQATLSVNNQMVEGVGKFKDQPVSLSMVRVDVVKKK